MPRGERRLQSPAKDELEIEGRFAADAHDDAPSRDDENEEDGRTHGSIMPHET